MSSKFLYNLPPIFISYLYHYILYKALGLRCHRGRNFSEQCFPWRRGTLNVCISSVWDELAAMVVWVLSGPVLQGN